MQTLKVTYETPHGEETREIELVPGSVLAVEQVPRSESGAATGTTPATIRFPVEDVKALEALAERIYSIPEPSGSTSVARLGGRGRRIR